MPELPAGYLAPFAEDRPVGLRRRSVPPGREIWRVDVSPPAAWDWTGFSEARYRFDPPSGAFRTRYAGATLAGTFRERYRSTGLVIPADHRTHHVVRLMSVRNLRVFDLRTEKNLDILQVDDQISTGQHPDVWTTCHRLADAVRRWWTDIDAIVYRSRTTPESSLNYAFFGDDAFSVESWALGERTDVLTDLVLHRGFTVNWAFDVD
ncbi:MAG TPA: RES family NAD+ phosphorylase [Mycobacterium sp.]|nr:RES family NAD+ phosphorylase [Mycobacterium sp.]